MSHFTVMVKLPASAEDDLDGALSRVLAPFQENNMGDCPREFLEFYDTEDEYREEYETDTASKVVMPDGRLLNPWDDEFRKSDAAGFGAGTHEVPPEIERRDVPFTELFDTFEEYMREWCGYSERDPGENRFGYWENPNAKWDWWQLGGRWGGQFMDYLNPDAPVIADGNVVRVGDLDLDKVREATIDKACEKWEQIEKFDHGRGDWKSDNPMESLFHGPRSTLMDIGLMRCVSKDEADGSELLEAPYHVVEWAHTNRDGTPGMEMLDIYPREVTRQVFLDAYAEASCPIKTYAVLDLGGNWHEPGKMGWWAMTDATPESTRENNKGWLSTHVTDEDSDVVLAVVDCHI